MAVSCLVLPTACGETEECPASLVPYRGRCIAIGDDGGQGRDAGADSGEPDASGEADAGRDAAPQPADRDGDGIADELDPCPSTWDPAGLDSTCSHRSIEGPSSVALAALLADGRVAFTGTASGPSLEDLQPHREVWIFDPSNDSMRLGANETVGFHLGGVAVSLMNGHVLFVGGGDLAGQLEDAVEELDPWSERLSGFGSLRNPRREHEALRLADGRVVVVGGITDDETYAVRSIEMFDADGTWTSPGDLPDEEGGEVAAVELLDGTVLITGGCAGPDGGAKAPSSLALIFDPAGGAPSALPEGLITPRTRHRMARLPDGRVLIVGGDSECFGGGARATRDVEVFDPTTGAFESIPRLDAYHNRGSAITLADGSALVIGGDADIELHIEEEMSRFGSEGLLDDVPMRPDELLTPRSFVQHSSVLLRDGSVLILGGATAEFTLAAGGERYHPVYLETVDHDFDQVVDILDSCPDDANTDQRDSDRDGIGDACDPEP